MPLVEGRELAPRRAFFFAVQWLERLGAHQLQGAGDRRTEVILVQTDALPGCFQSRAQAVYLSTQGVLTLAGRFEFLFDGAAGVGVQVGGLDVTGHLVDPVAADAQPQHIGQASINHLGQGCPIPS